MRSARATTLARLIALIDDKIAALPKTDLATFSRQEWYAYRRATFAALNSLASEERAATGQQGDLTHLRMAGISASSTQGPVGAMRNWQAGARRALERMDRDAEGWL